MPLEDDLRHSKNNDDARQAVIDKLGPAFKQMILLNMTMDDEQFREWVNYQHEQQDKRLQRKKTVGELIKEVFKWLIISGLTAVGTAFAALHLSGGSKP